MTRSRRRRVAWSVVVVGVLGLAALSAWLVSGWRATYAQAQQVQSDLGAIRAAAADGQWRDALGAFPAARASVAVLVEQTADPRWRLLAALPVVGPTATASTELAGSVEEVLAAVEPLEPLATRLLAADLRTADGAIDVAALSTALPQVDALTAALERAAQRMAAVDVAQVREPVAGAVADLERAATDYAATLTGLSGTLAHVPGLLGADGARTWLVLLQNPAEARGSGGFVGGYAVITADRGRLRIAEVGSSAELNRTRIPIEAASEDARIMWGDYLTGWNDFNLSPDFPLTARLAVAGMKARGVDVDGVVAIDPQVVAAIMAVTGPVQVDGVDVTAQNVARFFLVDEYLDFPDGAERDRVTMDVVRTVLQRAVSSTPDPRALADALREPVEQGRLRAWSADPSQERWLAGTAAGGVLPNDPGPVVAVTFNNSAANKLDAFVATAVDYEPGSCPTATVQRSRLRVMLRNDTPADLPNDSGYFGRVDVEHAPAGSTSMLVHLYLPVDADSESATIDGRPADLYPEVVGDRLAWWTVVDLPRDAERVIDMTFAEPSVAGVVPAVLAQPMAVPTQVTVAPSERC